MTTDAAAAQTAITATAPPPGVRTMVDSAFPHFPVVPTDIVLIYAGGDTPHPWTDADVAKMPQRWRWPCWVRSNPQQVSALQDAALCIAWLERHKVPKGTCVILDLETAVDAAYVNAFNVALRNDGWKVTKYGSRNYIWKNPKTDGGTYLAEPGPPHMSAVGDTVATQWGYEGGYDLSWVKDQATVPLWDSRPGQPKPPATDWMKTIMQRLPELKTGSTNHMAVRRAQALIRIDGHTLATDALRVDGIFGPKTEAAVKMVQERLGLQADGVVGPHTWAVLVTGADL